jgi:hypothetical protein
MKLIHSKFTELLINVLATPIYLSNLLKYSITLNEVKQLYACSINNQVIKIIFECF